MDDIQYSFVASSTWPIDKVISFSEEDHRELDHLCEDALVLSLNVGSFSVRWVLVDTGSTVDLMHHPVLIQMGC